MVAMEMRESVTTGGKERRADIVNEQFCTTAEDTPKTYRITTIDAACRASPADYLSIVTIEDKHDFDMPGW